MLFQIAHKFSKILVKAVELFYSLTEVIHQTMLSLGNDIENYSIFLQQISK